MILNEKQVVSIVHFDAADTWDTLLRLVSPDLDSRGLARIRAVLEADCRCVVIERHYIDKDYRDTFSHFHSKRFATPSSRCVRLHFFAVTVTDSEIIGAADRMRAAYLGYSIIRPTKPNCVGRTLLAHTVRLEKQAPLSLCRESTLLLGTSLEVEGFPFISQDSDATVCAQSALWMLLRYYSNKYPWYSEILPFQITNLATQHAVGNRVYPSSGLFSWQLAEALRLQRFSPVVYSRAQYPDLEALLYTYIESGLPLLIAVPNHVVVGYGHLSDYSRAWPSPAPDFLYSSDFNHGFIVSDDNCFPYQTLRQGGRTNPTDSGYSWNDIQEFIVPLPEKVFLTADHARTVIEAMLRNPETGITRHSPDLLGRHRLLRLFLTTSRSFKRHLRNRGMGHPLVETIYRNLPMPHFIWVCEIADFEEYTRDQQVRGEIIWDATRNPHEPNGWISLHYPEALLIDVGTAFNRSSEIHTFALNPPNPYSLFRSNLRSL
jgi:hypothetical protein